MPPVPVKRAERLFKEALFRILLLILRRGRSGLIPIEPDGVKSILFLRPDKLGDMITTIPAMHALKKRYPHLRVEIIASPRNMSLVKDDPLIDAVHIYAKNIFLDWPMMMRLRKKRFSVIFDPICHDSITGLLLSRIIGKRAIRAAARKLKYRTFYDFCEPYQPEGDDHSIDNSLLIFRVLGIDPESIDPYQPPYIPDDARERAVGFYSSLSQKKAIWIGINIAAGSPTRSLPVSKYEAIINKISACHPDFRFLIFCTMEERKRGLELLARVSAPAALLPENLNLQEAAAILEKVHFFISPDTSLVHIAGLMKIPTVGLYSGHIRNYHFWKPYRQKHGSVIAKNFHDLQDIEPEQVAAEFEKVYCDSPYAQAD
ncbi:hypothetical protein TRIP_C60356 [Candidatus Zixiibacteriota bacterium]|nr:hypothetical protein TRIP_C60356 [candidate division Zixibacteria bacterium]